MNFEILRDTPGEFKGLKVRRKTRLRICLDVFGGWLVTFAIVAALYFSLFYYSEVLPIMSQKTKQSVNALMTGLSIALSITALKGLNDFVATFRWWILSRHYYSLRKIDLILQAESVSHVIKLVARTSRLKVHAVALIWLGIFLVVQVALALLGLCYSMEIHDSMAILTKGGKVWIPSMSRIQTTKIIQTDPDSLGAQEYTANSYGLISLAFDTALIENIPAAGSIWTVTDPLVFCGGQRCVYVFHDKSAMSSGENDRDKNDHDASEPQGSLVVSTNRTLNSTAVCQSWQVTSGGNGTETSITIGSKENGTAEDIFMPSQGGINQTTFITNTVEDCGAGCRVVTAFEAAETNSWYYRCNITVSYVGNASRPEHEVSEGLRSMAAAAIALQGIEVSSLDKDDSQYQVYPAESVFGLPKAGSNDNMASSIARFAIGTIAICAQSNDPLVVNDAAPIKGSHIVVNHWNFANLILVSITVGQLVLGIATAIITGRIVIPEGGPFAIARVLSPIMSKLRQNGKGDSLLDLEGHQSFWIYRSMKTAEEGIYDLFMEEYVSVDNTIE